MPQFNPQDDRRHRPQQGGKSHKPAAPDQSVVTELPTAHGSARSGRQRPPYLWAAAGGIAVVTLLAGVLVLRAPSGDSARDEARRETTPLPETFTPPPEETRHDDDTTPAGFATAEGREPRIEPDDPPTAARDTVPPPKLELSPIDSSSDDAPAAVAERDEPPVAGASDGTDTERASGGPVDLLKLIDPRRDAVAGEWRFDGDGLLVPPIRATRLQIPYDMPDEYVLTAIVEQTGKHGAGGLRIGLVAGDVQPMLTIDDGRAIVTTLTRVNGQGALRNETRYNERVIVESRPSTIVCIVSRSEIRVIADGKTIIDWEGDRTLLSSEPGWPVPHGNRLFLGGYSTEYRITRLELSSLGPSRGTDGPGRPSVPDPDDQQLAERQMRELFKDDYSKARRPEEKAALASKLLGQGKTAYDDAVARFVLLREACDLAVQGNDTALAQEAIDEMALAYDVDSLDMKRDALKQIARTIPVAGQSQVAQTTLALADDAVAEHRYDLALEFVSLSFTSAAKTRDLELRNESRTRREEIVELKKRWDQAEQARQVLTTAPDNAEANATLGMYLCFVLDDWPQGLPHLARAVDADLRAVAKLELQRPDDATQQAELADTWWKLAQATRGPDRERFRNRAADWYRRAVEGLTGLEKVRVERRIQEFDRQVLGEAAGAKSVKGVKLADGLIGRIRVDRVDVGMIYYYQPGKFLKYATVRDQLGQQGIPTSKITIQMIGVLHVPEQTNVAIRHIGGSAAGGVLRLYLNDRELGSVGDDRTKDTTYNITLGKGNYWVKWELNGGDLGNCKLEFTNGETQTPLPVFYTKDVQTMIRRLPTRTETDVSSN